MKIDVPVHIVDDDRSVRTSVQRLLRAEGVPADTYASAEDFLEALPTLKGPACALLDIGLPGLDGLELHARIKDAHPDFAVVFLTGHGDVPGAVLSMKRGAVDFLLKPFDASALLAAIARAAGRAHAEHGSKRKKGSLESKWQRLTPREREVMTHVVAGRRNKQVAIDLGITEKTVKVHRARVMQKFEVRSLADLVRAGESLGVALVAPES